MNLAELLQIKFPKADFIEDIKLRWNDEKEIIEIYGWNLETPQPTKKQLEEWQTELEQQYLDLKASEKRRLEYPSIEELTLALWKSTVLDDNKELLDLQAKREEIQAKYPKSDDIVDPE